jgi:hypothetical protein
MPEMFEPVEATFGKDADAEVDKFVHDQLEWLERAHKELHEQKIPKWRKNYLGTPAETQRNFPFPNAANTVVQVVGETVDTMTARVLGLLYATHPLWVFKSYVKSKDPAAMKAEEEKRQSLEDFMDLVGMEPHELNLQEVESLWFTDAARLGTSFVKLSLEDITESVVVGYDSSAKKKIQGNSETVYKGPRVTKLRHEDVLTDPRCQTMQDSDFNAVRRTLTKSQLEDRKFSGSYDEAAVDAVLGSPDRSTPREQQRQELQDQGISPPAFVDSTAEYDVYECFFGWWHNGRKYRLIMSYHKKTKTVFRRVFNFLPENALPIIKAKLGYRTDGAYAHGYAELLELYQEELSTTHNQRLDNATVANTRALRVSPRARALDANVELYPTSLLIGDKDEIEAIQIGDVYPSTFKNEEMTLGLVARRAGISPAVSGSGTGGMQKRPQIYSAGGTLAVMQENNSVVGQTTSEFRHAHVMLGALLTRMYGKFGTNGKEECFGVDGPKLEAALKDFAKNRMRIPIRTATGSLNKEIDKQTGMLMAGVMQRHYTAVAQLLQAISSPMVGGPQRDYFTKTIQSSEMLHRRILKDFGYEQPDLYIPEAQVEQQQRPVQIQGVGGGSQSGGGGGQAQANGGSPMGSPAEAIAAGSGGPVPAPGVGGGAGVPVPR